MKILTGVCLIFLLVFPSSRRVFSQVSVSLSVVAARVCQLPGRDMPETAPAAGSLSSPRLTACWEETLPEDSVSGGLVYRFSERGSLVSGMTEFRNTLYRPYRFFLKIQAPRMRCPGPDPRNCRENIKNFSELYMRGLREISAIPSAYYVFTLKRILV